MFWLILGAIILLILLLYHNMKLPIAVPAPNHLPLLGNVINLGDHAHLVLTKWAKQHGNLIWLTSFRENILIVSGYDAVYEALYSRGRETSGRYINYRMKVMLGGQQSNLSFRDSSPEWKKLRSLVHFSLKQYGQGMERIEDILQELSEGLVDAIERSSDNGVLDPYESLHLAVINAVSSMLTGRKYNANDPVLKSWIYIEKTATEFASPGKGIELDMFPWLRYFGNFVYKMSKSVRNEVQFVYNVMRKEYELEEKADKKQSVLNDLLMEQERQMEKGGDFFLTDEVMENVMFDLMTAGTATTSSSLCSALLQMAAHPDVQERINEEITSLNSKQISLKDQDRMPYTRACILEVHRFTSVAALGLIHKVLSDTVLQGVRVPKGTILIPNIWSVLHDEDFWKNPYDFNPERFLDEEGELLPVDHPNRRRMLAFGAGPRMCLGQGFANARMFIFLTAILKKFRLEKAEGEEFCSDCRDYIFNFILSPKRYNMKFLKRQ